MKKLIVNLTFLVLGFFLLSLNILGLFIGPIEVVNSTGEQIPGYHYRELGLVEAQKEFSNLGTQEISDDRRAEKLLDLIAKSYLHGSSYQIQPWDNWIMWVGGKFYEPVLDSQDANLLWRRGAGFCHQAATIYITKAEELGFEARFIGLGGHVVAEVKIPKMGWRVVDPDHDIFWEGGLDAFGDTIQEDDIIELFTARGYSEEYASAFADIYTSQENNNRVEFPAAPNRYIFEKTASVFKWLLPLILIGIGLYLSFRQNYVKSLKFREFIGTLKSGW